MDSSLHVPVYSNDASSAIINPSKLDLEARDLNLLVFDMGHVFVDFEWDQVLAGFGRLCGKTNTEMRAVMRYCAQLGYESGKCDTARFIAELSTQIGVRISLDEFSHIWNTSFHENQEMAALLQILRKQKPLFLLSNTNEVHYEFLQSTYQVARHFDELILSYKVGCAKPDEQIYREVLRLSGQSPESCLFVDDLKVNVEAANKVGMHTIQFTGVADLKTRLSNMGFRIN